MSQLHVDKYCLAQYVIIEKTKKIYAKRIALVQYYIVYYLDHVYNRDKSCSKYTK